MARQIKPQPTIQMKEGTQLPDDYKDRLVKLIPSEIVTAYVTIQGIMKGYTGSGNIHALLWIVFVILLILTPVYLHYISKVNNVFQIIFTSIAFVLWVIVIGGPIDTILGFNSAFIGSIFLVLYTLVIPFIYKGQQL